MTSWTENNIPSQTGRIVLVTGANSGLGLETTRVLSGKGAQVIMACRNVKKAEEARDSILKENPEAHLHLMTLDLGSLASARQFATDFRAQYDHIDLLYNNAGLMAMPYGKTADGFETQLGVNHLGHFALTGLLLDLIMNVPNSRIVTVSSTAAWFGRMNFDDLQSEKSFTRYGAYGQAKLANALFAFELQRRLSEVGSPTLSLAAQPGFVYTELQKRAVHEGGNGLEGGLYEFLGRVLAQPVAMGTLPQLYAGVAPDVKGSEFYSPERFYVFGYPKAIRAPKRAYNTEDAQRLWQISEELTGVKYAFRAPVMA